MNPQELLTNVDFVGRLSRSLVFDEHRSDDVAQETWLAALRSPPEEGRPIRSWLRRVVLNFARKQHRGERRRLKHEAAVPPSDGIPTPAEIVEQEEARRRVVDAVLDLDDALRDAIVLRYYRDLPHKEAAARLGIPLETLRTRLKRGLARLRDRLDAEYGGDRKKWSLLLAPFACFGVKTSTASAAAVTGAMAMSAKVKIGAAAAVILASAFGLWRIASSPSGGMEENGLVQSDAPADVNAPDEDPPLRQRLEELGYLYEEDTERERVESGTTSAFTAVRGIVKTEEEGRPVPFAEILLLPVNPQKWNWEGDHTVCDADGRFLLKNIPKNAYVIAYARADGFALQKRYITAFDDSRPVEFTFTPESTLIGKANNIDGTPMEEFDLELFPFNLRETNIIDPSNHPPAASRLYKIDYPGEGRFVIHNLPRKFWLTLVGNAPGYASAVAPRVTANSKEVLLTFTPQGASVEGKAFIEGSGEPLINTLVRMSSKDMVRETYTDEHGRIRFFGLPAGTYALKGYPVHEERLITPVKDLTLGEDEQLKEICLNYEPGLTFSGTARGKETGEPLADIALEVKFAAGDNSGRSSITGGLRLQETKTDGEGRFIFEGPFVEGKYRFNHIQNSGRRIRVAEAFIDEENNDDIELKVRLTPQIEGVVLGPDLEPISGAQVKAVAFDRYDWGKQAGVSGSSGTGRFSFYDLEPGEVRLFARKWGSDLAPSELTDPLTVPEHGTLTDVTLQLTRGKVIQGHVRNEDGIGIEGARISCDHIGESFNYSFYTSSSSPDCDEPGFYKIQGVGGERVRLFTYAKGYISATREIKLDSKRTEYWEDFTLTRSSVIAGRALDATGSPADFISVRFEPMEGGEPKFANVDVKGVFRRTLPEGLYRIIVTRSPFSSSPEGSATVVTGGSLENEKKNVLKVIENVPTGTTDLKIVLDEIIDIQTALTKGAVIDAVSKQPVINCNVMYVLKRPKPDMGDKKSGAGNIYTQINGRFEIKTWPGELTLTASHPDYKKKKLEPFYVKSGDVIENIKIKLERK